VIVEDFICLGRTVPEESKKYGHKVCMAGYSAELGQLLRVYPLPVKNPLRVGFRYVLSLERNASDSRAESWKLTDRVALYESTEKTSSRDILAAISCLAVDSIATLNERRASLGVLVCEEAVCEFQRRESVSSEQLDLFDWADVAFGANAISVAPYLRFDDATGTHRLQLREWGCYEWIRKNVGEHRQLSRNLRIDRHHKQTILVGNMSNHRNTWLIIKSWATPRVKQLVLPYSFPPTL
jgi:hypothetical protein